MSWKNRSYWLKGGLIGAGIGLIYFIFTFLIGIFSGGKGIPKFLDFLFFPYFGIVNFWCNNFILPKCTGDNCGCNITMPSVIFIAVLILIGAIIGFIIGKFKEKKK